MKTAAFFDIDGTLYRDSLMMEHFKKLLKYEVIDQNLWHSHVKQTYENWKKRRADYDEYMMELAEIYIGALTGLERSKMEFVTDQVIKLQGDKVYAYTRERILWHQQEGHLVFFISGSPDYLVKRMAKKYGITDSIGTKYLIDEHDRYTGQVIRMWDAKSKNFAMLNFAEKHEINLSKSYAYGDTNGDISMFKLVGNPIAINPTKELLHHVKADANLSQQIQIIVERKDVIYKLTPSVTTVNP